MKVRRTLLKVTGLMAGGKDEEAGGEDERPADHAPNHAALSWTQLVSHEKCPYFATWLLDAKPDAIQVGWARPDIIDDSSTLEVTASHRTGGQSSVPYSRWHAGGVVPLWYTSHTGGTVRVRISLLPDHHLTRTSTQALHTVDSSLQGFMAHKADNAPRTVVGWAMEMMSVARQIAAYALQQARKSADGEEPDRPPSFVSVSPDRGDARGARAANAPQSWEDAAASVAPRSPPRPGSFAAVHPQ